MENNLIVEEVKNEIKNDMMNNMKNNMLNNIKNELKNEMIQQGMAVNKTKDISNQVLSPEELKELDIRNENRFRTYISSEAVLSSWIRNTIILFMGGITVINFSDMKEKYILALFLSLTGILIGIVSYTEFKDRKKKIYNRDFGGLKVGSFNENLTSIVLIIFLALFILRSIRITEKYSLKKVFKF